ncbi:DNA mismatch repair protein Mlh3 isoform X2 [Lampris incognitus]|uniref:DNA mismatch repair protein Mlh3 isoform X2 n=1 Tax=Lampris incognitus TaxID=2546036 RepID=UPI0024B4CCBC|nr:DNA mismatch repair protein Mlh3 isoform X2 [Lampris incognitus]
MIKCLSEEVQAKLRSGVAVSSLQQCVEELILNSVDAGATCMGLRTDMGAFKVRVIDNGSGIDTEDMEAVGKRYFTSKCSSVEDLENLRFYGFRGEALASIVSLASLVEITSRTKSSVKTQVKVFKGGKGLDVFEAETARPSAGTTVVVCDFFHNMPVRRKRMDAVLESERIRQRIEAISLMHPAVSFTLKNDCTGDMIVQLPKARDTYHRFVQIHGLGRAQKLGEISYAHRQFEVSGHIGREGYYNNSLQFLFVNGRLVLKTQIHKLLNLLLRSLRSSGQKNDSPDGQSAIRSPKQKKRQELHGMYIINIKCCYSEYDICLEPAKTLIEFKDWDGILLCIEEAVKIFLVRENLVAELSQDDWEYASPKLCVRAVTVQEGKDSSSDIQTSRIESTMDCIIGKTLASEFVHRRFKEDCLPENSVEQMHAPIDNKEYKGKDHVEERSKAKEKKQDHRCTNTVYRVEPQCNVVTLKYRLEACSENNMTKEDVPNSNDSVEESQSFKCLSSSVSKLESSSTASKSSITVMHSSAQEAELNSNCIPQMQFHHQSTNSCGQRPSGHRKISISNPYVHESLLALDLDQKNRPSLSRQVPGQKCQDNSCILKRKFSFIQGSGHLKACQKVYSDLPPAVSSKIRKITSYQKLSLIKEAGSLDTFRRMYKKSSEIKSSCLDTDDSLSLTHDRETQNFPFGQREEQERDVTEIHEIQSDCQSSPTVTVFTKLKPISRHKKSSGISLATKLCHLKQHRTEVSQSTQANPSQATSLENSCHLNSQDDIQDSITDDQPCPTAPNPEHDPSCHTSPQMAKWDESAASGDWFHHYDDSVGRMMYINKVTGLSCYDEPPVEETQALCTSDVTNMAVSVISRTGDDVENSNSLSSLYSEWSNPVFVRPPMVGVNISSGQADGLAVKIHNILFPYRFSKAMIHSMKVIHQVDKKFLACLINTRDQQPVGEPETEGNLLVLVDQHAAHERVRLENLIADSYEDNPDAPGERRLCSSTISPPLEISVTEEELRLLRSCQPHLRGLGLEVVFTKTREPQLLVKKVPLCFTEKESNELRRGRRSVIKSTVEEYLREHIELLRSTGSVKGTLPLTVLKVLASLACHGAIKFNDSLSYNECCSLVGSLSSCQLPFQCAHGRPSIAPLVDILHLDNDPEDFQKPNLRKLRKMYKAWELYGKV